MDRNAQHHRERLNDAIRDEISAILEGELGDPRIGLATVSAVEFTRVQSRKVCARSAADSLFSLSTGVLVMGGRMGGPSAPGVTRTRGQRFRKPLLYPSELQGQRVEYQKVNVL